MQADGNQTEKTSACDCILTEASCRINGEEKHQRKQTAFTRRTPTQTGRTEHSLTLIVCLHVQHYSVQEPSYIRTSLSDPYVSL